MKVLSLTDCSKNEIKAIDRAGIFRCPCSLSAWKMDALRGKGKAFLRGETWSYLLN